MLSTYSFPNSELRNINSESDVLFEKLGLPKWTPINGLSEGGCEAKTLRTRVQWPYVSVFPVTNASTLAWKVFISANRYRRGSPMQDEGWKKTTRWRGHLEINPWRRKTGLPSVPTWTETRTQIAPAQTTMKRWVRSPNIIKVLFTSSFRFFISSFSSSSQ